MPCLCPGILVKGLLIVGCLWLLDLIQHNCVQGLGCYSFATKDIICSGSGQICQRLRDEKMNLILV